MISTFSTARELKNQISLQNWLKKPKQNNKYWLAFIDPAISLKWEKSECITESSSANCHSLYLLHLTQDNILPFCWGGSSHWVQNPVFMSVRCHGTTRFHWLLHDIHHHEWKSTSNKQSLPKDLEFVSAITLTLQLCSSEIHLVLCPVI